MIENADQIAKGIDYKLTLLSAEIASKANELELADKLFAKPNPILTPYKTKNRPLSIT